MTRIKGNGILFSEMTPSENDEEHFNEWYFHHHMPSHVYGVPGFLSGQRYRHGTTRHYLAIYELVSTEALEHPEYRQRKYTPDAATRSMLSRVDGFTRFVAREFEVRQREPFSLDHALGAAAVVAELIATRPGEAASERTDLWDSSGFSDEAAWRITRCFDIVDANPGAFDLLVLHYLEAPDPERPAITGPNPPGAKGQPELPGTTRQVRYERFGRRYRKDDRQATGFVPRFAEST